MEYLVVFVVCLFAAVQAGLLTAEQKEKIMKVNAECMKVTGVDEAVVLKAQQGEYADDPKLKQQIFCFNKQVGFQNEAGDLQVDVIKSKIVEVIKDEKKADEFIQQCNIKKENGEETGFAAVKCFHDLAPTKDIF